MSFAIKSIFLVLSILALINSSKSDDCVVGLSTFGLCQEFQALRDLAPHASVINIIKTHWQTDSRFRRAAKFMLSSFFGTTTQEIDASSVYQSALTQFTNAGVNTTDINSIYKIFNCLIIPLIQEAIGIVPAQRSVDVAIQSRSLETALVEVNNLIPTSLFVSTLTTHLANNTQFASFYKVLRQPSFQTLVLTGFVSRKRYILMQ